MAPSPGSRLSDTLARRRLLYPGPIVTAPSVLVIDVPREMRGRGLALDRYYGIILETDAERNEIESFLAAPRPRTVRPDLFDHRPSNLWTDAILVSRYHPPAPGWPWLCVAFWPESFSLNAQQHGISMARGRYTMEMFRNERDVETHCAALLDQLADQSISVGLLAADTIAGFGRA